MEARSGVYLINDANSADRTREIVAAGEEARARLRAAGFAHIQGVLGPQIVAALRAELDGVAGAVRNTYGLLGHNIWRSSPTLARVIRGGGLARLAATLLAVDEILWFQDNLVWKPPGTASAIHWHQDAGYLPLTGCWGLTLWICLDAADADNGGLRYLPGTHRLGEQPPVPFEPVASPERSTPPAHWTPTAHAPVDVTTRPGDVLAHHPLVWHMSPPNRSGRHRRAIATTWLTSAARWAPARAAHPFGYQLRPTAGAPVEGLLFPRFRFGD